jgi:hypothetical protein
MYTLRLIFTGLVFLLNSEESEKVQILFVKPPQCVVLGDTPCDATNSLPDHQATLSFPVDLWDPSSRAPTFPEAGQAQINLDAETVGIEVDSVETKLALAEDSGHSFGPVPTTDGASSFLPQRSDLHWVTSLGRVLEDVELVSSPRNADPKGIDSSLDDEPYEGDKILGKVVLTRGRLWTYLLWSEVDPAEIEPDKIGRYSFGPSDEPRAVARSLALDLLVRGDITVTSRPLNGEGRSKEDLVLKGREGEVVELRFDNRPVAHNPDHFQGSHFRAFYSLLNDYRDLTRLPRPIPAAGADDDGACSPGRP